MVKRKQNLTSEIGWSTPDRITVRGLDLPTEILGEMNLGDLAFLLLKHRKPSLEESRVFNAIVVTLVEHGLTPSALVVRMTYLGAPEALQAVVAAGLSGLGTVFVGSMEGAMRMLSEAFEGETAPDLDAIADCIVADFAERRQIIPGLGHPMHKPVDPRTPRLFDIAAENGLSGDYIALIQKVQDRAAAARGKALPINATGGGRSARFPANSVSPVRSCAALA